MYMQLHRTSINSLALIDYDSVTFKLKLKGQTTPSYYWSCLSIPPTYFTYCLTITPPSLLPQVVHTTISVFKLW